MHRHTSQQNFLVRTKSALLAMLLTAIIYQTFFSPTYGIKGAVGLSCRHSERLMICGKCTFAAQNQF
jgi:hypothetical protein